MNEITSEMLAKWEETVSEPPPGYWVPTSEVVTTAREMLPAVTHLIAEVERLRVALGDARASCYMRQQGCAPCGEDDK